jgi:hypothetical protein
METRGKDIKVEVAQLLDSRETHLLYETMT